LGLDFAFFDNRVFGSLEAYDKITADLLLSQPLQLTTGFSSITRNVGQIQNRGIELTLGVQPVKSLKPGGFNWTSTFIFTYNNNRVKKLYDGLQELPGNPSTRVNRSLGSVFTQQYAGVNAATGRPMWLDTLGNVTYQPLLRDRVYLGDTQPDFWGGWTNNFTYKGFTLDVFFQYEYGRMADDGQVNFMLENIARLNAFTDVYDNRWTTPGQITWYPRMGQTGAESKGSSALSGSRTLFKADYIRLKNVTLSYDISSDVLKKLKLSAARFYLQGTNLWTMSDWYSYDIEFVGSATGIVPQSRNITAGIQIGF
jgi:hypothetical protein